MTEPRRKCEGPCGKNRAESSFTSARGTVCSVCRKQRARERARAAHVLKTYGLSADDIARLLASQGDTCAICHGKRTYNLAVDHDHNLAEWFLARAVSHLDAMRRSVRGLLCKRCNKLLRDVRDNPQILRAAADYIEDPPARKVLVA